MAGYLDEYGAGDEERSRNIKRALILVAAAAVVGGILFFFFHNYSQESQVRRFIALEQAGDYKGAYALWGCTDAQPCRDYPFSEFLKDWGPQSGRGSPAKFRITKSRSCGSGVILTVDLGRGREEKLWVERSTLTIGFPPFQGICPAAY